MSPAHLFWVWGSSREGGRRPCLQSAGCLQSPDLWRTPSSRAWSLRTSPSSWAELCGPAPASPALYTDGGDRYGRASNQAGVRQGLDGYSQSRRDSLGDAVASNRLNSESCHPNILWLLQSSHEELQEWPNTLTCKDNSRNLPLDSSYINKSFKCCRMYFYFSNQRD